MIDEFEKKTYEELEKDSIEQYELMCKIEGIKPIKDSSTFTEQDIEDWWDDHKSNNEFNNLIKVVDVEYKNETYKTWTVEYIKPLVNKFLKELYPDSIVVKELNDIDLCLIDNKSDDIIPIEIQKSTLSLKKFMHTEFENRIRKQLDDNIDSYNICWFFFDSEYLRYLQSKNVKKTISINMTWFTKLMKENKLKVFSIRYDGLVKELNTKDFDFLKCISNTCPIGYENDERILNRNKLKIYKNIIKSCNYNQEEIDNFYKIPKDADEKYANVFKKSDEKRCKLYGNILYSMMHLSVINRGLGMNIESSADFKNFKFNSIHLKIIEIVGNSGYKDQIKIVDKFDICKYFPGYVRREKLWLIYKNNVMSYNVFYDLCIGRFLNHKTIFDFD